jgi:hypothetical protein
MNRADDAVSRWEQRNAQKVGVEIEHMRRTRVWAAPTYMLWRRTLNRAVDITAAAVDAPPNVLHPVVRADPTSGKPQPGVEVVDGADVDMVALKQVFAFAFKKVTEEWAYDFAQSSADKRFYAEIGPALPALTVEEWKDRVRAWSKAHA